jgi:hypothetical protein
MLCQEDVYRQLTGQLFKFDLQELLPTNRRLRPVQQRYSINLW